MLIKQLSMFGSWCTNMIIISTLSTESIQRITSKCLTECFQCHQEKFCLRSQSLSLLPIHLPLSSCCSAFFYLWMSSVLFFDILLCTSLSFISCYFLSILTHCLWTLGGPAELVFFLGCSIKKEKSCPKGLIIIISITE